MIISATIWIIGWQLTIGAMFQQEKPWVKCDSLFLVFFAVIGLVCWPLILGAEIQRQFGDKRK